MYTWFTFFCMYVYKSTRSRRHIGEDSKHTLFQHLFRNELSFPIKAKLSGGIAEDPKDETDICFIARFAIHQERVSMRFSSLGEGIFRDVFYLKNV